MHDSIDRPLDLLKWGKRLLWLELFIALIVVMGYWTQIITLVFLGAILACILPQLFIEDKEEDLHVTDMM